MLPSTTTVTIHSVYNGSTLHQDFREAKVTKMCLGDSMFVKAVRFNCVGVYLGRVMDPPRTKRVAAVPMPPAEARGAPRRVSREHDHAERASRRHLHARLSRDGEVHGHAREYARSNFAF